MARYRKVDPRIWNDAKFISLSDRGKLAFLFVLTHPHMTAIGAMRATCDGLASELGWNGKQFREAIGPAVSSGMVELNEVASFVALPKFLRFNEPEGPNSVRKAWIEALGLIPECREKHILAQRCLKYLSEKSEQFRHSIGDEVLQTFASALSMPCDMPSDMATAMESGMDTANPCPIQEQEQEQEQKNPLYSPLNGRPTPEQFEEFWASYPTRENRKVGRVKAAELFHKLKPSDVPLVMRAVRNYAASKRVKDGFAKDAFRFLQKGFWRDWIGEPEKPKPKRIVFQ